MGSWSVCCCPLFVWSIVEMLTPCCLESFVPFFSKKVASLCCRWRRYAGDLDLAVRATCSLASEKVKLDPSLSVKENWQSLAVRVEQNAKHSLIRDLVSTLSLSCQLRTTITQQLATGLSPFEGLSLVFNQFSCHCYRCYTLLHHFREKLQVNDIMSPSALIHFIGIVVWSHCTTDWPAGRYYPDFVPKIIS